MTTSPAALYKGFQFPQHILAHAVWLYFRSNLSYRDVEALLAQRGVVVTYKTIRHWWRKLGQQYANQLRRRVRPSGKWHLDKVFLTINGQRH